MNLHFVLLGEGRGLRREEREDFYALGETRESIAPLTNAATEVPGVKMPNHKRKRPKNRRAGCLMCKPHKMNGAKGGKQVHVKGGPKGKVRTVLVYQGEEIELKSLARVSLADWSGRLKSFLMARSLAVVENDTTAVHTPRGVRE